MREWFLSQQDILMTWNDEDPPDAREIRRTKLIAKVQGTVNPFVEMPHMVKRIVPHLTDGIATVSRDTAKSDTKETGKGKGANENSGAGSVPGQVVPESDA